MFGNECENYLRELYKNEYVIQHWNAYLEQGSDNHIRMEGPYQRLLDVWFALLKFGIRSDEAENFLKYIREGEYVNLNADPATQILLEKLIGLFWYWDSGNRWRDFKEALKESLCPHAHLAGIVKKLDRYAMSLDLADKVLNHEKLTEAECSSMSHTEGMVFAKAWESFWNEDIDAEKQNIRELCRVGNRNHDYMESVQGYLNMVRHVILLNEYMKKREKESRSERENGEVNLITGKSGEKETLSYFFENEKREEERSSFDEKQWEKEARIGGFRYARIQMEQLLPVFLEYRQTNIETGINAIYRQKKKNTTNDKIRVRRLIALQILDAVQYWNLSRYIECIRQLMRLDYLDATYRDKNGVYKGEKEKLFIFLIRYMECVDSYKIMNDSEMQQIKKYMVQYAPEELESLTKYICEESLPVMWKSALQLVALFAENFSKEQRKRLIEWLVRYNAYYKGQKRYFNTTQYEFLKDWCQKLEEDEWRQLKEIIEEIFRNEGLVNVNRKLVDALLPCMPWDWCEKFLNQMYDWPETPYKKGIIYSMVILLSKRSDAKKRFLHQYVCRCVEKLNVMLEKCPTGEAAEKMEKSDEAQPECTKETFVNIRDSYQELDQLIDIQNLSEREPIDLEFVEAVIFELERDVEKRGSLQGYDSRLMQPLGEAFTNKNWNVEDVLREKQLIERFMNWMMAYDGQMSANFFHDLCHILCRVEGTCGAEVLRCINKFVIKNMVKKRFETVSAWGGSDGPYEAFRFDDGMHNQYEILVSLLLVYGMTTLTKRQKAYALDFMMHALKTDETILYNYITVFGVYIFLTNKAEDDIFWHAWGILQRIVGRILADGGSEKTIEIKENVQSALDVLENSENSRRWFGKKGYRGYVEKNKVYQEWLRELME